MINYLIHMYIFCLFIRVEYFLEYQGLELSLRSGNLSAGSFLFAYQPFAGRAALR
jgi:hypothetical protein